MGWLMCEGGPYHRKSFNYPDPVPNLIVIADATMQYHEYRRVYQRVYRHVRAYRVSSRTGAADIA